MSPAIDLDVTSLLVGVAAAHELAALERELGGRGFTLGVALDEAGAGITVGAWLARGAPGAPSLFADPADHLLAGLEATLRSGQRLEVRPGPRRAVGPDLTALLVGAGDRFGRIERAWLRVHHRDVRRPALALPGTHLDPPVGDGEARLLAALEAALDDSSLSR